MIVFFYVLSPPKLPCRKYLAYFCNGKISQVLSRMLCHAGGQAFRRNDINYFMHVHINNLYVYMYVYWRLHGGERGGADSHFCLSNLKR